MKATPNGSKPLRKAEQLAKLLRAVFKNHHSIDDPRTQNLAVRDFLFHMTDWSEDLLKLADLYEHPERHDTKSAGDAVAGFLNHAMSHIQAAGELMLDFKGFDFPETRKLLDRINE